MDCLNKIAALARYGSITIADRCGEVLVRVVRPKCSNGGDVFPEKYIELVGDELGPAVDAAYDRASELEVHG